MAHICKSPVLPDTPLPPFSPKVVVGKPHAPRPSHQDHNPGPPPVILGQRMGCIVMNKQYWYHRPIQIYHLHPTKTNNNVNGAREKERLLKGNATLILEMKVLRKPTQWLDCRRPITQKSKLTLTKKKALAKRRGWCKHHVHRAELVLFPFW